MFVLTPKGVDTLVLNPKLFDPLLKPKMLDVLVVWGKFGGDFWRVWKRLGGGFGGGLGEAWGVFWEALGREECI